MKKAVKVIFAFTIGIIIIGIGIYVYVSKTTTRLVCKSSDGNVIIFYNDTKIINSLATKKISFDPQSQKEYIKKIGIDTYIDRFSIWFSDNTNGSCVIK